MEELINIELGNFLILLLAVIPAAINFFIFYYIFRFFPPNRCNRVFVVFVLLLGIWQLTDGLVRMSATQEEALVWFRISGVPCMFFIPFGVLFAVQFTSFKNKVSFVGLFLTFFLPAIIFVMCMVARLDEYIVEPSSIFRWIISPVRSSVTMAIYIWISFSGLLMLFLFAIHYKKNKYERRKKTQALLLLIGFAIPVVGGIIGEVILPLVFRVDAVPVTTSLVTCFSLFSFIAIKKYDLLSFSPKHHWENIVESMNDGILIVNNDGCIEYANKKFCKMVGYSLDEMKTKIAQDLFMNGSSKKEMNAVFMKKDAEPNQYYVAIKTKNNATLWALTSNSPYTDINGNIIGSISIHRDSTELISTQEDLRSKINELNVFFYHTSHDMKAPVSSMLGLFDFYERGGDTKEFATHMKTCVGNLSTIIDRVSETARVRQKNVEFERIDTGELLTGIIADIHKKLPELKNIKIKYDIRETVLVSDRYLLQVMLKHILENAFKYSNTGVHDGVVEVKVKKITKEYVISVIDKGKGISQDIQDKLFQLFFKGDEYGKGVGLGLYIVKCAAEKLQGKVGVKSEKTKGSEFSISLPFLTYEIKSHTTPVQERYIVN